MVANYMCDGSHCILEHGEVRIYPLGGGGNMIYCKECFAHENRYRAKRGVETKCPENFPQVDWDKAKTYAIEL